MRFLENVFSPYKFMYSYCYIWKLNLLRLNVMWDCLIAVAYVAIGVTLVYFIRKKRDLPFNWVLAGLGISILACGAAQFMGAWSLWHATDWLSGAVKAVTATASILTAILIVQMVPRALTLPNPDLLRSEIAERKRAQEKLRETKDDLELRASVRTMELTTANEALLAEMAQRERVEEALRESEEQLRLAQNASGSGVWDWNPRIDKATWSDEHFRIFGLEPSSRKFTWATFFALIHPDDRARVQAAVGEALKPNGELEAEYRIVRPDHQVRWVMSKGQTYCDGNNQPVRTIGLTMDITERKQLEQALLKTQAELAHVSRVLAMGELTSSIAHEVNQPLAAMVTNGDACLRWLAADPPNLDKARQSVTGLIREGNRAGEVIKRIRVLVRKTAPQKIGLQFNEVIAEVVGLMDAELAKHHIALQTELEPQLPAVFGDRVQLQQVILNLMANSIEAMSVVTERARELAISSRVSGNDRVLISVCDSGAGFGSESIDHYFEAFFTTKEKGMGLGLSISRTIIEAHGGRLWGLANAGPGVTFQLTLPIPMQACA
jgi:PAS domain S-box-containing protein